MDTNTTASAISGFVIPFAAVIVGGGVTLVVNRLEAKKTKKNQIIKVLELSKRELVDFLEYIQKHPNGYRLRRFVSGEQIVNSPVFNMKEHGELLKMTFDMLHYYEMFNTGLESIPMFTMPMFIQAKTERDVKFADDKTGEIAKNVITTSTKEIVPKAKEMIVEIDRILSSF